MAGLVEKFQSPDVIRFTQAVLDDQLHAELHPGTGTGERQDRDNRRNLPDVFHRQGEIGVRQIAGEIHPLRPFGLGEDADQLRGDAQEFERHVGLPIGQFQAGCQDRYTRYGRYQGQQQGTFFEIPQRQGAGLTGNRHSQVKPGQNLGHQLSPVHLHQRLGGCSGALGRRLSKFIQQQQNSVQGVRSRRRLRHRVDDCSGRVRPQLFRQPITQTLSRVLRRHHYQVRCEGSCGL